MEQKTEASQAVDLPLPPMPLPVVKHAVIGDLFDCFAMQQYAMRYADLVVAALKAQPAHDHQELTTTHFDSQIPKNLTIKAQPAPTEARIPDLLFDGMAVYGEIVRVKGRVYCGTTQVICDTLDAVVRLLRAAPTEAVQDAQPSGNSGELAQGEDSARLDWLIENVSSGSIGFINGDFIGSQDFDELKVYIDRARASAETGGVKPMGRAELAALMLKANPGDTA